MNTFTFPDPRRLPGKPKRFILHWTAGAYHASDLDKQHYHILIEWHEGEARIIPGVPIKNNMAALGPGVPTYDEYNPHGYAAHTRGFNSWSIGVTMCGMFGAIDRDNLGDWPIVPEQVDAMIGICAAGSAVFGMDVTEETFFTHFEAQSLHHVPQVGKWDICWTPSVPELGSNEVGPWIRARIRERLEANG